MDDLVVAAGVGWMLWVVLRAIISASARLA